MIVPYIVSADIQVLLKEWAIRQNFTLPDSSFFHQLREDFGMYLRYIFTNFELISEDEITCGLANIVTACSLPAISMDRVYYRGELHLDIARLVNEDGNDCGLGARANSLPLSRQIKKLQMSGVLAVTLVDDVVYSGGVLERIIGLLSRIGIKVPYVCTGIGLAKGIKRISSSKRKVYSVRTYEDVIDMVCERDFYPGVPFSGRLLAGGNNIGVPYLLPFGNPEDWASIPSKHAPAFSQFCLEQTITLFNEIERCSKRQVLCKDLGRKIISVSLHNDQYTGILRTILEQKSSTLVHML